MSDELQSFLDARDYKVIGGRFQFEIDEIYIFRFIVNSYFKEQPSTGANAFLKSVVGFLSEDLNKYHILGITLKKLKAFQSVKVHYKSYGVTTTDRSVMTDDASWALDIVVKSAENETSWTNPTRWVEHVANALGQWIASRPVVNLVGAVTLPIRWYMSTPAQFKHVYAWWNQRQPVYYVAACTKEQLTDPNFKENCPTVTFSPFSATSYTKGLVGEDGLGFAYGLADYPDPLQPINIKDKSSLFIIPGNGKDERDKNGEGKKPGDGSDGGTGSKSRKDTEQYLIFGAFAVVGYVLWQKLLKEMV